MNGICRGKITGEQKPGEKIVLAVGVEAADSGREAGWGLAQSAPLSSN